MSKKRISLNQNSYPLVSDLHEEFLKVKEIHGASAATIKTYRGTFKRIQDFIGQDATINQLNNIFYQVFKKF